MGARSLRSQFTGERSVSFYLGISMKLVLFVILTILSNLSLAGDDILLKVTCSPDLEIFEVSTIAVDYNYDKIKKNINRHEYISKQYDLFLWPDQKGASEIKCYLDGTKIELKANQRKLSVYVDDNVFINRFVFTDRIATFGPSVKSISIRAIGDDASAEICTFDRKSTFKISYLVCKHHSFSLAFKNKAIQVESLIK
jgi:hypothetical protein